jgi:hypothetical protein
LVDVNAGIFPLPALARPIEVWSFVQVYTVPGTVPETAIELTVPLLQSVTSATGLITGVGFTVMVNVEGVPAQVFPAFEIDGVIVIVAVTGEALVFSGVNDGIFPDPLAGKPMAGVSFTQL